MIYIGIDVAKDKHDCFITNSDGEVLFKVFTIANNLDGFNELYQKIESVMEDVTKVKVGLEATGHYSYNLLGYLIDKGLPAYVINPLHTSIPGINYRMGAMIIAEIGDFSRFDSPDKILAYAGLSPSTYQSGQLDGACSHMEKRGSRYLRYALFNAAKYVCHWDPTFAAYSKPSSPV